MTAINLDRVFAALDLANEVRTRNAKIKRDVAGMPTREGLLAVAAMLDNSSGPHGGIPIGDLMHSVRRIGSTIGRRMLTRAGIYNADRRVRDLTPRQRSVLADVLKERAGR